VRSERESMRSLFEAVVVLAGFVGPWLAMAVVWGMLGCIPLPGLTAKIASKETSGGVAGVGGVAVSPPIDVGGASAAAVQAVGGAAVGQRAQQEEVRGPAISWQWSSSGLSAAVAAVCGLCGLGVLSVMLARRGRECQDSARAAVDAVRDASLRSERGRA